MEVVKFERYWDDLGCPDLEVLTSKGWILRMPSCEGDSLDPKGTYRIKGDKHWELREEWIDSDKKAIVEVKCKDKWSEVPFPAWDNYGDYRIKSTDSPEDLKGDKKQLDQGKHYRNSLKLKITEEALEKGYVEYQLDPFRLQKILNISCAVAFTVFKKSIRWGGSEAKDLETDLKDIISACERKLEMLQEDKG